MIELIDNPQSQFEKNEEAVEKDSNGLKSFWEWEQGLLENEELYWEGKLRNLKAQITQEVNARLVEENIELQSTRGAEINADISNKHSKTKAFLVGGWQRAKNEHEIHLKQKDYRKFQRLFHQYAYPLNSHRFKEGDSAEFNRITIP